MAKLFLSKEINEQLNKEIEEKAGSLIASGVTPTLAFLRVGDRTDDISYERSATKRCEKFGINTLHKSFSLDATFEEIAQCIKEINNNDDIHGLLMLRPLPSHLDEEALCNLLDPRKDIDGITDTQAANIYKGATGSLAPCTSRAVVEILKRYEVPLTGKNVVVIGRSLVIGKPVSMMLLKENATVTICHSKTTNLADICRRADIIIAAVGKERFLTSEYVSEGQVVIDVGIHVDSEGNMCGDVDFDSVSEIVSAITPVPGGVGGVTTSILILTLLEVAECK